MPDDNGACQHFFLNRHDLYSICSYFAFRVQLLFACNHLFKVFFTATPGADDALCSMPKVNFF